MLVVVSPAKKLNMEPVEGVTVTEPAFARHAEELAGVARALGGGPRRPHSGPTAAPRRPHGGPPQTVVN